MSDPIQKDKEWEAHTGPKSHKAEIAAELKVWNIPWLGSDFAIWDLVLVHSSLWFVSHPLRSLSLAPPKEAIRE